MRLEDLLLPEEEKEYKDGLQDGLANREPLREPWERVGKEQDSTVWVPHKGDTP